MAFLNGTFLGYSTLQYQLNTIEPVSYNKVTLYGGESVFSKFHIQNKVLSEEEIKAINPTDNILWQPSTILLANFNHTLDGGNIIYLPSALIGWKVYRRDVSTDISTLIATVGTGISTYIDYGVSAYRTYIYEILPYTEGTIGAPLITNSIETNFFGWYLMPYDIAINGGKVFKFDFNLDSSDLSNEVDVKIYETYTKKPSVGMTDRDYLTGTISCIAGTINVDGTLYQPTDYISELRSFINNKKPKILKSRKGDVWKVVTYGMPQSFNDEVGEQITTITFNFSEVN